MFYKCANDMKPEWIANTVMSKCESKRRVKQNKKFEQYEI